MTSITLKVNVLKNTYVYTIIFYDNDYYNVFVTDVAKMVLRQKDENKCAVAKIILEGENEKIKNRNQKSDEKKKDSFACPNEYEERYKYFVKQLTTSNIKQWISKCCKDLRDKNKKK